MSSADNPYTVHDVIEHIRMCNRVGIEADVDGMVATECQRLAGDFADECEFFVREAWAAHEALAGEPRHA